MSDAVILGIIIALAVALVFIVIIVAILLYNQMLLLNEVNKRLLLMTKESVDKERSTQEDLTEALRALDAAANEQVKPEVNVEDEEPFNPHTYDPEL